ncbi:MAG: hypothetical protein HOK72_03410 [Flavobacteriales bacterium]|jgi:hypothetical protein|nr:hypothetical protein [Flavobacteriales bacterium]
MVKLALLSKLAPDGQTGKIKNISSAVKVGFSGIGVDQGLKFADNALTKGVIQSFGITLPIIGRVSGIDIINYIAHNNGNIVPKSSKPFIALGASKVVQAGNLVIPKFATGGQNVAGTPAQTGIGF